MSHAGIPYVDRKCFTVTSQGIRVCVCVFLVVSVVARACLRCPSDEFEFVRCLSPELRAICHWWDSLFVSLTPPQLGSVITTDPL